MEVYVLKGGEVTDDNKVKKGLCKEARYWEQPDRAKYMDKYKCHFNSKTAAFAVKMLENRDPKDHHRWTCEQVAAALKPMDVVLTAENKWDAYYIANMLYSDYFDGVMFKEDHILHMAAYKINDPDAKEGDIYTMLEAKQMNHCTKIEYSEML